MMKLRRVFAVAASGLALFALSSCGGEIETENDKVENKTTVIFAMDTVMELSIYGSDEILEDAEKLILDIEAKLSVTDKGSEIYALNNNQTSIVSKETAMLLQRALDLCEWTGGTLDISIYPILCEWGFTTGEYSVPDDETIRRLLPLVDYRSISVSSDNKVYLPMGAKVDLGSVAKGYTADMVTSLLRENGVTSALLNLGGNVQAIGRKPDGKMWRVAVADPCSNGYVGSVDIENEAVITSGGYKRNFVLDGKAYCHIIDPETGYPVDNDLLSVTIVGSEGIVCDALSTALFVMGKDAAIEFWRREGGFEAVFVDGNRQIFVTPGVNFTPNAGKGYEVIKK